MKLDSLEEEVRELVSSGHAAHDSVFSIKAEFAAHDADNDLLVCVSEIITGKGVFVGYGIIDKTEGPLATQIERARLMALRDGLRMAGIAPIASALLDKRLASDTLDPGSHVVPVVSVAESAKDSADGTEVRVICTSCGEHIKDYVVGSGGVVLAERVVEKTIRSHGSPYCAECSGKQVMRRFAN